MAFPTLLFGALFILLSTASGSHHALNITSKACGPRRANLSPSQLSEPYATGTFADNPNFTFWPGSTTNVTGGPPGTLSYTIQLTNLTSGSNVSAWHDIPLNLSIDGNGTATLYTLVEIPIGEQAKYETTTSAPGNPIQQDTDPILDAQGNVTGQEPRYYVCGPSLGNYGGLPHTWSNSNVTDSITGFPGDNDPLDVLDISSIRAPIGGVYKVKVLGTLGMIDKNESDWKTIVINVKDPRAARWNDITDVPEERLLAILEFYANYKQAENKPAVCFWRVNLEPGIPQPDCGVSNRTSIYPLDFFHNKTTAVQVIQAEQQYYQWLLAGNCKSEACDQLWYPGNTESSSEGEPAAAGK